MIPVSAVIANAANPSFNAVFFKNGFDYLLVSIVLAFLLTYLVIPAAGRLIGAIFGMFGIVLKWLWRGLAIVSDLLFIAVVRLFKLKRLPSGLDFGASVRRGDKGERSSRWEAYRGIRKPVMLVLVLTLTVLLTLSDMYKWHEKKETIRGAYAAVMQTFRGAGSADGQPDAAEAETDQGEEEQVMIVVLNERGKEGGNLRADASLTAAEIGVVMPGDVLLYLEEKSDGERIWYKVRTPEGREGWVSSVISDKVPSQDGQHAIR